MNGEILIYGKYKYIVKVTLPNKEEYIFLWDFSWFGMYYRFIENKVKFEILYFRDGKYEWIKVLKSFRKSEDEMWRDRRLDHNSFIHLGIRSAKKIVIPFEKISDVEVFKHNSKLPIKKIENSFCSFIFCLLAIYGTGKGRSYFYKNGEKTLKKNHFKFDACSLKNPKYMEKLSSLYDYNMHLLGIDFGSLKKLFNDTISDLSLYGIVQDVILTNSLLSSGCLINSVDYFDKWEDIKKFNIPYMNQLNASPFIGDVELKVSDKGYMHSSFIKELRSVIVEDNKPFDGLLIIIDEVIIRMANA